MKLKSNTVDLGYPIYGAKFLRDDLLIVAGGGGEADDGVPNKLTALLMQPENVRKPIRKYRELPLKDFEDCPMSLDVNNNIILAGINENSQTIKEGINKHLRKFRFENDHLRFTESYQVHSSTNPQHYQKLTKLTKDGTQAVIVMNDNPSSVYIVDTAEDLEEKFKVATNGDVKDISISPDGKMMCYITSHQFQAISTITGRSVHSSTLNFNLSKVSFYDNNIVVVAGTSGDNIAVAHFSISKSSVIKQSTVIKKLKGLLSMDVNPNNGLISLAGSDCSIYLVRVKDLKLIKKINQVHAFAITKIVSNERGNYLVSVSAANSLNLIQIPENFANSKSIILSFFQLVFSIAFITIFGISLQFAIQHGYLQKAQEEIIKYYNKRKPADSSHYFSVEPLREKTVTRIISESSTTTYMPIDDREERSTTQTAEEPKISIQPVGAPKIYTEGAPSDIPNIPVKDKTIKEDIVSMSEDISTYFTPSETYFPRSETDDFRKSATQSGIKDKTIKSDIVSIEESTTVTPSNTSILTETASSTSVHTVSESKREVTGETASDADTKTEITLSAVAPVSKKEESFSSSLSAKNSLLSTSLLSTSSISKTSLEESEEASKVTSQTILLKTIVQTVVETQVVIETVLSKTTLTQIETIKVTETPIHSTQSHKASSIESFTSTSVKSATPYSSKESSSSSLEDSSLGSSISIVSPSKVVSASISSLSTDFTNVSFSLAVPNTSDSLNSSTMLASSSLSSSYAKPITSKLPVRLTSSIVEDLSLSLSVVSVSSSLQNIETEASSIEPAISSYTSYTSSASKEPTSELSESSPVKTPVDSSSIKEPVETEGASDSTVDGIVEEVIKETPTESTSTSHSSTYSTGESKANTAGLSSAAIESAEPKKPVTNPALTASSVRDTTISSDGKSSTEISESAETVFEPESEDELESTVTILGEVHDEL